MKATVAFGLSILSFALAPARAQLDDLGKVFEKAAKKVARDSIAGPNGVAARLGAPGAPPRSEIVPVKTADGWTLVAHHFRPKGAPRPGVAPVILCHGLSYNATFWDLDPSCSLVEFLTTHGYDVWVADLRGSGSSSKWVAKLQEAPEMMIGETVRRISGNKIAPTGFATVDPKFANWTLDHHIAYDVPAFVKLVKRQTKAQDVTWIGHSMGGIVAICHLARHGNPGIGRLITVGSQVTMPNGQLAVQFAREMIETRTRQLTGRLTAEQVMAESRTSVQNMFFNQQNVLPTVYEALGTTNTDVPAMGVMQQYMNLGMTGQLMDSKKQFNYATSLGSIQIPVLISCGADDQFAPPTVQKFLYENIGSQDKTLVVFGRQMNFGVDAGHDDALVGLNSQAEVYPILDTWMRGGRMRK